MIQEIITMILPIKYETTSLNSIIKLLSASILLESRDSLFFCIISYIYEFDHVQFSLNANYSNYFGILILIHR
jgi:hypothetical protein